MPKPQGFASLTSLTNSSGLICNGSVRSTSRFHNCIWIPVKIWNCQEMQLESCSWHFGFSTNCHFSWRTAFLMNDLIEWFRQGGKGGIYIGCKSPICRNKCLVFVGRWGKRATDGASDALSRTWGKHSRGRLAKINLTSKVSFVERQIFCCEGKTMTGMDAKIASGYLPLSPTFDFDDADNDFILIEY